MADDVARGNPGLGAGGGLPRLQGLQRFTPARIALGRSGTGQPTAASLRFMMDHARARDAVHAALNFDVVGQSLRSRGWSVSWVHSAAKDRAEYLRRPDLGRRLSLADRHNLDGMARGADVTVVAADGLSASAIASNLLAVLDHLTSAMLARGRVMGPLVFVEQGRVAIGDEIGELLEAKLVLVLIGERPGLSSADSLGAYITWKPRIGIMDSSRNCISNIRPAGLTPANAAIQIADVIDAAFAHAVTGVRLNAHVPARALPRS
jgi:ethanolamine ammonia-lyase small subunit